MDTFQVAFFILVATASVLAYPGVYYHRAIGHDDHKIAYPKYNFKYGVKSDHTGDVKSHWESRDGDVVRGSYTLNEPDGIIRQVDYTADKHGYKAVVKKFGHVVHPKNTLANGVEAGYLGSGHHGVAAYSTVNGGIDHFGSSHYSNTHFGGAHIVNGKNGAKSYSKGNIYSSKHYSVPNLYVRVSSVRGVGHHNGVHISGGHPGGATSYSSVNRSFGHLGSSQYSTGNFGGANKSGGHHSDASKFGGGYISGGYHADASSSYSNSNIYSGKHYPGAKSHDKFSTVTEGGHLNGATSYSKRKDLSLSHFIGHHF